jgi:hypothetical protein
MEKIRSKPVESDLTVIGRLSSRYQIVESWQNPEKTVLYSVILLPESKIFVKTYSPLAKQSAYQEFINYQYLGTNKGWLTPSIFACYRDKKNIVFVYEFIEGNTLYDNFSQVRNNARLVPINQPIEAIKQIVNLSLYLDEDTASKLILTHFEKPSTFDLLLLLDREIDHKDLNRVITILMKIEEQISGYIPGYFFDRNTRNMIQGKTGNIYQIDSEVISNISPMLDVAFFLRTGYNVEQITNKEIDIHDISMQERILSISRVFRSQDEEEILYQFKKLREKSGNTLVDIIN